MIIYVFWKLEMDGAGHVGRNFAYIQYAGNELLVGTQRYPRIGRSERAAQARDEAPEQDYGGAGTTPRARRKWSMMRRSVGAGTSARMARISPGFG